MTLNAPSPRSTSRAADAAHIERWAATKRADLTRLTLALRKAEAAASRAEESLAGDDGLGGGAPVDVLSVIDARLAKAVKESEEGVEAAQRDATLVLSSTAQSASTMLKDAGLDSADVLRSTWRPPEPVRRVQPPRRAEDLWNDVMASVPAEPLTDEPVTVAPPSGPATVSPRGQATSAPIDARHVARDEGDGAEDTGDAAQVYDLFWGRVPSERPVRERLRRRTERGAP